MTDTETIPVTTLGQRLKALRVHSDWTQQTVAQILRMDQASISFWETDKVVPMGSSLVALAALFRVSVEALETGKGFLLTNPAFTTTRGKTMKTIDLSPVMLPPQEIASIQVLPLSQGTIETVDFAGAATAMAEAVRSKKKIWVLIQD